MKKVNETYFPRGGTKKALVANKLNHFKKSIHHPKKQVLKKKSSKPEPCVKLLTQKIENLSIHTLMEGMLVVGCVREIHNFYMSVYLAGRISARLPITAISPIFTKALQELTKGKITEEECPPLSKLFQVGETLCCHVNSIEDAGISCTHVNVSISPEDVNKERSHSNVKVGDLLIAAVEFREDYGYLMFTGINGLTAFLKHSEAVKYIQERNGNRPLVSGQVIRCIVTKAEGGDSSTFVEVTVSPDVVCRSVLTSDINMQKLIPTTKVEVIIKNIRPNGLEVNVMGCSTNLACYVGQLDLERCWSVAKDYTPGTRFKATVLYVIQSAKSVFLSLKEELSGIVQQKLKNGAVINNTKVAAVTNKGVCIMIGKKEAELKGFVRLKHIYENIDAEKLPVKYPVGTKLQTRVIDFDPVQQIYNCSLERGFIKENYVTVSDVKVGDIVNCTVKTMMYHGAELSFGRLTAYVPALHVSDVPVKKIESVLSVGEKVKARVLSVKKNGSIIATLKATLLESTPLMSYQQAEEGDQYCGEITSINEKGFWVTFYNDVRGYLPCEKSVSKDFVVGQSVKCVIVHAVSGRERITLGFTAEGYQQDQNTPSGTEATEAVANPVVAKAPTAKPAEVNPVAAKTPTAKPAEVNPVAAKTPTANPAVANPVAAKTPTAKPAEVNPVVAKTPTAKPAVANPVAAKTPTAKRAEVNPVVAKTLTAKPAEVNPVAAKPVQDSWLERLKKCTMSRRVTAEAMDALIKEEVFKFITHVAACYHKQDYEPGTTLIGKVTNTKGGIHVVYTNGAKGVLLYYRKAINNYTPGQEINAKVLWQDPTSKLVYLQPPNVLRGNQNVDSRIRDYIGSLVKGHVLFSTPEITICVLFGSKPFKKLLAYIPYFDSVLREGTTHRFIIHNIVGNFIICLLQQHVINIYNDFIMELPQHTVNVQRVSRTNLKETHQSSAENREYNCGGSEPNKQNKRKIKETSFTEEGDELSVVSKKMNCSLPSGKEGNRSVNTESKQNKKQKKKEIVKDNDAFIKRNKRNSKCITDGEEKNNENVKQIQDPSCDKVEAEEEETQRDGTQNLTLSETGFFWDAKPDDLMGAVDEPMEADDSEEDEEESNQKLKSKSRMTAAEKRAAAKEAELKLRQKEAELLEAEVTPQSADQFDRALLSNPENAELWIKYMAYHLQATEIEKARSVARRALQTMSYRSEGERLNVWIALLNLENMYGTQESLKETLDEALKTNDDYLVYSKMLEIYANSNKSHDTEQLVNIMLRKFRESEACWLHCCTNLMNCGLHDKARNLLQRALSSLQTKEHVNLISKFALLENKHGFKEKAVTLLENVLITYPGRVDVWNVYVDMLVKSGDITQARQVLERAANQKLTARKMKTIYSKWLSFEEKFGDENSVQHVKKAALHYVNTITSKLDD